MTREDVFAIILGLFVFYMMSQLLWITRKKNENEEER